jgi:hypothetical protein
MDKQYKIIVLPGADLHAWVEQQAGINRRTMGQEVANILDIYRASLAPLIPSDSAKIASVLKKTATKKPRA